MTDQTAPAAPPENTPPPAAPPAGTPNPPAGAPAAGQPSGAPGEGSVAYRPEGLPDHLFGTSDRETIDRLYKGYAGAREAIARFGSVPEAPEKYAFTPAEAVAPYLPDVANDPVMKVAQQAAHKHGLGDKQFSAFVNEFMGGLVAGQMLEDPFSAEKERAIVAGDVQDPAARAKKADQVATDTIAFIDAMQAQGKIPKEIAEWAKGRTDRGHFLNFVQAMRAGTPGLELGGQGAQPGVTRADLEKRHADPRNQFGGPQYDAAFAAETDRLYRNVIGDGEPSRA